VDFGLAFARRGRCWGFFRAASCGVPKQ
jgi:hypothetical protein